MSTRYYRLLVQARIGGASSTAFLAGTCGGAKRAGAKKRCGRGLLRPSIARRLCAARTRSRSLGLRLLHTTGGVVWGARWGQWSASHGGHQAHLRRLHHIMRECG